MDGILSLYGIDRQHHIVGLTTDNCAMMVKVGKLAKVIHRGYMTHAIHLGFSDFFYSDKFEPSDREASDGEREEEEEEDEFEDADIIIESDGPTLIERFMSSDYIKLVKKIRIATALGG
ncbi:hypothetical protein Ciccas_013864 [Cichlidogyrus casuarinus]|uniref:Uncharacterized protein n=1 Tax=Cichlidogyrus casuarinus TaxID=1844966 RepID=A0ABD2PKN9_9PLAT